MGYSSVPELIHLSPTEHVFLLNEDKEIHKKAASGGGCSQTVAPLNRTSRTDDPNEPWCVVNTKLPVETALDSKPDFTFGLFHIKSAKFLF